MNIEELLRSCYEGKMPLVECADPVRHASSPIGRVVVIKYEDGHKGCAVRFPGMDWDTWFWDSNENDGRKHYMRELKLLPS